MAFRVLQPLAPDVGGCTSCCWHQNATSCTERIKLSRIRGAAPLPIGVQTFLIRFNGVIVETGSSAGCTTGAYMESFSGGLSQPYGFYIDIWRAYNDGVWTSSVDIEVFWLGSGGAGTVLTTGPETDTSICTVTNTVPNGGIGGTSCTVGTANATVTITDTGGITVV